MILLFKNLFWKRKFLKWYNFTGMNFQKLISGRAVGGRERNKNFLCGNKLEGVGVLETREYKRGCPDGVEKSISSGAVYAFIKCLPGAGARICFIYTPSVLKRLNRAQSCRGDCGLKSCSTTRQ